MSRRRPPWSSLDLDPTADERVIKRAYARKLKEIDVETEPAKFIALRAAMEDALRQSRWIGVEDDPDDDDDWDAWDEDERDEEEHEEEGEAGAPVESVEGDATGAGERAPGDAGGGGGRVVAPVAPLPERPNPWSEGRDRIAGHFAAIEAALRSEGNDREAVIDREVRALWAEPATETVDAAEDVEQRLAYLVLNHEVAAVYLLRLASWHYGWARRSQQVGTGWPISEAGLRAGAENWFQKVESGATGYAKSALADLAEMPSGNWLRDLWRKRRIRQFLEAMRRICPEGEYRFDPDIVAAWEEAHDFRFPWMPLAIGFGIAIAMAGRNRQSPLADPVFWGWWIGAAAGLLLLTQLVVRRAERQRRRGRALDLWEAGAFALLLAIPPIALLAPASLPITALLIAASFLLFHESGAAPPTGERAGFWSALIAARYPLIAALLLTVHAIAEAPTGRMDWRQAVVPAALAMIATHWARPRLVESWEAAPRWLIVGVRYALLAAAAGLLWITARILPERPAELAVAAGFFVLLAQDAAADGYRRPLSTPFLIAYVLLLSGLAILPLPLAMALVVRRLADRLFIKA